jgi:hypothetical protein
MMMMLTTMMMMMMMMMAHTTEWQSCKLMVLVRMLMVKLRNLAESGSRT